MKKIVFVLMCVCLAGSLTSFADTVVYYNDYNDPCLVGTGFPAWNWGDNGTVHTAVFADYNDNILVEHTGTITGPINGARFGSKWDIALTGNTSNDPCDYIIELDLRNVQGNWDPHEIEVFVLTKETGADVGYGLPTLDINQADGWVHVTANLGSLTKTWWAGTNWDMTNPNWSIEVGGPPYPGSTIPEGESWTQILLMDNLKITLATILKASHEYPSNGATDAPQELTLTWWAGAYDADVNGHRVYFDDVRDNVTNRNGCDVNGVVTTDPCYTISTTLPMGKTYYWAVDEVNDACAPGLWPGDVWIFTTADYTPVDNFESYEKDANLTAVWKKVARALIYIATDANFVHSGDRSMQVVYRDSSSLYYSEVYADTATLPSLIGSDWSAAKLLTLYFKGLSLNDPNEPMYVKLTDGSAHTAKVLYDGNRNYLKDESWHEWNIPLPLFTGVSMANVTRITIGFGDGLSSTPTWTSYMYFDDIRVYLPKCVFSERSADFAKADYYPFSYPDFGDCMINGRELEIMANTWLAEDDVITPTTDPNILGGLVAYYPMNEGSGTIIDDANGNPSHQGTFSTAGISWATPGVIIDGNGTSAVYVNGLAGSRISIGTLDPVGPTGGFTLSIWAKWGGLGQTSQGLIGKRDGWASNDVLRFMFEIFGNNQLRLGSYANSAYSQANIMQTQIGRWAHIAATVNGNDANNVTFYLNGQDVGTGTCTLGTNTTATMTIGNSQSAIAWEGSIEVFNGELDEVRIYNRALSPAEIAYLADTTLGDSSLHVPVPSYAELYEGEPEGSRIVNFRDFAFLANMWLEEQMWPR